MKIGILTDPSKTFIYPCGTIYKPKYCPSAFEGLPENYKNEKQCFLNFLGGNFSEVLTFVDELSKLGPVEVMLYLGEFFIHQDEYISPHEVYYSECATKKSKWNKWLETLDILILSLSNQYMNRFKDMWPRNVQVPVIGVGGKTQKEIYTSIVREIKLFLFRRGVTRFGRYNREMIKKFIEEKL